MLAPSFLLLALLLLFLRLLPWLLSLGSAFAARGKRAVALLALAQMARAPRQAIRMTLLLALALAFASFTLVLAASQNQRALDIAAYTIGADFSGDIATSNTITSLQAKTASYRAIPGVSSASVGFVGTATARTPRPNHHVCCTRLTSAPLASAGANGRSTQLRHQEWPYPSRR